MNREKKVPGIRPAGGFRKLSRGRKLFLAINYMVISLLTIVCVIPVWTMFCYSVSSAAAVSSKLVTLWPVDFTAAAYRYVMSNTKFWTSLSVTMKRVILGVPVSMLLILLAAYPLSKSEQTFTARKYYVRFFIVAMLFNGGLIPTYIVISKLGLMDKIWCLVLPGAVQIFDVVLMMNFFRSIPSEIEEAAIMDGASQWQILWRIVLPVSKPAIATVSLFVILYHWNSWFDGLLYMNTQANYPLQSYLQSISVDATQLMQSGASINELLDKIKLNNDNLRAAQIFVSMIPIMAVYPWLQKYFTTGIVMGSVKG